MESEANTSKTAGDRTYRAMKDVDAVYKKGRDRGIEGLPVDFARFQGSFCNSAYLR